MKNCWLITWRNNRRRELCSLSFDLYREAVATQSPGLLQPWVAATPTAQPQRGCGQSTTNSNKMNECVAIK
jgi:hypothetical protein